MYRQAFASALPWTSSRSPSISRCLSFCICWSMFFGVDSYRIQNNCVVMRCTTLNEDKRWSHCVLAGKWSNSVRLFSSYLDCSGLRFALQTMMLRRKQWVVLMNCGSSGNWVLCNRDAKLGWSKLSPGSFPFRGASLRTRWPTSGAAWT